MLDSLHPGVVKEPHGPALRGRGGVDVTTDVLAIANIATGTVPHPFAFAIVLIGFGFFLVAKASVAGREKWIGFGPRLMSPGMANLYRVGYWLMAVGILATYTEWR